MIVEKTLSITRAEERLIEAEQYTLLGCKQILYQLNFSRSLLTHKQCKETLKYQFLNNTLSQVIISLYVQKLKYQLTI